MSAIGTVTLKMDFEDGVRHEDVVAIVAQAIAVLVGRPACPGDARVLADQGHIAGFPPLLLDYLLGVSGTGSGRNAPSGQGDGRTMIR